MHLQLNIKSHSTCCMIAYATATKVVLAGGGLVWSCCNVGPSATDPLFSVCASPTPLMVSFTFFAFRTSARLYRANAVAVGWFWLLHLLSTQCC